MSSGSWQPCEALDRFIRSGPARDAPRDALQLSTQSSVNCRRARAHASFYDMSGNALVDLALRFSGAGGKVIFAPTLPETREMRTRVAKRKENESAPPRECRGGALDEGSGGGSPTDTEECNGGLGVEKGQRESVQYHPLLSSSEEDDDHPLMLATAQVSPREGLPREGVQSGVEVGAIRRNHSNEEATAGGAVGGRQNGFVDGANMYTREHCADEEEFCIHIKRNMRLIPACHQGMNRSQVLRLVLLAAARRLDHSDEEVCDMVSPPHGATTGCDPYRAFEALDGANFFLWLHDPGTMFKVGYDIATDEDPQQGPLHRAFVAAFGCLKSPRVGEDAAYRLRHLNDHTDFSRMEHDRRSLREFMSKTLFAPQLPPLHMHRTRVFIAFCRAAPIIMERLLETWSGSGVALNAIVVALPWNDDLNTALREAEAARTGRGVSREEILLDAHLQMFQDLAQLFFVVTDDD